MRILNKDNNEIIIDNLLKYGFIKDGDIYTYKTKIYDDRFCVIIEISDETIKSKLIELENDMEYTLVDVEGATGKFISSIRNEYEDIIKDFLNKCTKTDVLKESQTIEIAEYIKQKYDGELEFLWNKYPTYAVVRKNTKWYALIAKINKKSLGFSDDEFIEIINLKYDKDKIDDIIDNESILPGYHMNKKNWVTIVLDGKISIEKIKSLIDNSYSLAVKD